MTEKLLTLKEAADYLGLSEDKLRELVSDGAIPAYHVGGVYLRFRKEQLEQIKERLSKDSISKTNLQSEEFTALPKRDNSIFETIKDFVYFYDFYIISIALISIIIFLIYLSHRQ